MNGVLTVAAGSINRTLGGNLILGNGLSLTGWSMFPAKAFVKDVPLFYSKNASTCKSAEQLALVPTDAIIICEDQYSAALEMLSFVASSKAVAGIIISDDQSPFKFNKFPPYPGIVISPEQGLEVIKYAQTSSIPSASITFQQTFVGTKPASSSYLGILKPDIMAPGTLVLDAWNPNIPSSIIGPDIELSSDFTAISGTSMSCPRASGLAALLKGAQPEWSPAAIHSAMMITANHLGNSQQ